VRGDLPSGTVTFVFTDVAEAAWAAGRTLTADEAVVLALDSPS
jgi:hypothetical protein